MNCKKNKTAGIIFFLLFTACMIFPGAEETFAASSITKLDLYIEGEIQTGDSAEEVTVDVTSMDERYEVGEVSYVNGIIEWDRRETPRLAVDLFPTGSARFKKKALENCKLRGVSAVCVGGESIHGEGGPSGIRVFVELPPLSSPGDSARRRMQEIEKKYEGARNTRQMREARAKETADGWYQDVNGWWYLKTDRNYPISEWLLLGSTWYYFDEHGYMVTGWREVGGKWYYMDASGAMLANTVTPDGYTVGADGAMLQ